jgi:MFS transporter, DHA2 family, multidrug resistance protein
VSDTTAGSAPAAPAVPAKSGIALWVGFGAMIIGQFMAFLDIQIVASSLWQVQSGIGASADEISWVQTAYLIPEVVMIPLSAYLSRLWGTQRLYMMSCAGFVIASVATGLSTSIEMMIVTRALQGFVGGAMIPCVFSVAFTAFQGDRRILASTLIGMIVTLAPTMGPALGGWITENLDWRWLFFINVVPGLLSLALVARFGDFDRGDPSLYKSFDWWGLAGMAVFLMSMQYVLEEGAGESWFRSEMIVILTTVAVVAGIYFFWRTLTYHNPVISLEPFANRNFAIGTLFTFVMGLQMFSSNLLLPLFLGQVGGMPAGEIGKIMGVMGITMFFVGPLAARVVRLMDPRILMVSGLLISAFGVWQAHALTPEWGFKEFAGQQVTRAVGMMMAMVGSQQISMSTLPPHLVKNASGIINLGRNLGGAIGLAMLTTVVGVSTREQLYLQNARFAAADPQSQGMMAGMVQRMTEMGVADPEGAARKALGHMIERNAMTVAFGEGFALIAGLTVFAAILALLARPVKADAAPTATEAH